MSIPNATPAIVEDAFSAEQLGAMRSAFSECLEVIDEQKELMQARRIVQHRANSVGFDGLRSVNRAKPLNLVLSAFLNSKAHDYAIEQFPEGYCFLLRNCSFRHHDPQSTKSHLSLHFDANFLGTDAKAINLWVPLDDLGDGVPGLTFLAPGADPTVIYRAWKVQRAAMEERYGPGHTVNIFFDRDDVMRAYSHLGDAVFMSPRIRAGGFFAFHQLVAHATEIVPPPAKPRSSIEFRICGAGRIPERYRIPDRYVAVQATDHAGRRYVEIVESVAVEPRP